MKQDHEVYFAITIRINIKHGIKETGASSLEKTNVGIAANTGLCKLNHRLSCIESAQNIVLSG